MTVAETTDQVRAGIHILLVDDYDINHLVVQQYLERAGYEVDVAQIDSTRVHIAHKEYRLVASEAHAIKGGAANLLAVKLSKIAAELENAADQNSSAKTATLVDELEEELNHLAKYLQQTSVSKA